MRNMISFADIFRTLNIILYFLVYIGKSRETQLLWRNGFRTTAARLL